MQVLNITTIATCGPLGNLASANVNDDKSSAMRARANSPIAISVDCEMGSFVKLLSIALWKSWVTMAYR